MNMQIGVIGYKGKIGSLLTEWAGFVPVQCDVTNPRSVRDANLEQYDYVVNLAAISRPDECEINIQRAAEVNLHGAEVVANYAPTGKLLYISSDHVYSAGRFNIFKKTEKSPPVPVNVYGMTKMGGEQMTLHAGGKILRLSRVVSIRDHDISGYLTALAGGMSVKVPSFFYRNYLSRRQACDGIYYTIQNWHNIPNSVNYGSDSNSMYNLIRELAKVLDLYPDRVQPRNHEMPERFSTPRPKNCTMSIALSKRLGYPKVSFSQVIEQLKREYNENALRHTPL